MKQRLGGGMFVYIIVLIVGFSLFLVNGNSNIVGPHADAPHAFTQAIPKQTSGTHGIGSVNDQTNLQVGQFDFVTVTPTQIDQSLTENNIIFTTTDGTLSDQAKFDAEQHDYIDTYSFQKSTVTIDGTSAVKITGTMPYQVGQDGQHITGPAQVSIFYVTHGSSITKFDFSYLGDYPDSAKEAILTRVLSTIHLL